MTPMSVQLVHIQALPPLNAVLVLINIDAIFAYQAKIAWFVTSFRFNFYFIFQSFAIFRC